MLDFVFFIADAEVGSDPEEAHTAGSLFESCECQDGCIKKVMTVRTLTDAMNNSEIYKGMLSEVDKLFKLFLTLPVTSATVTAERAFSSLRCIKTFLRSTLMPFRLNNLFFNVHTGVTDVLVLTHIAKEFVC